MFLIFSLVAVLLFVTYFWLSTDAEPKAKKDQHQHELKNVKYAWESLSDKHRDLYKSIGIDSPIALTKFMNENSDVLKPDVNKEDLEEVILKKPS
jgi:hypothetical protein